MYSRGSGCVSGLLYVKVEGIFDVKVDVFWDGWMLRTHAFFRHLLYESEIDEKLSFEAYHGSATKEGGCKVIPRPLTAYPNITHTRRYSPFDQVSVLAFLILKLVRQFTLPAPHTTNNNTTHAVKKNSIPLSHPTLIPIHLLLDPTKED